MDLDTKAEKRRFWSTFYKDFKKEKLIAPKVRKSADKSLSQPGCSHSNTIYNLQLQKTIVLRMQPRHQATLTQPLQCDLQRLSCKTQKNYAQRCRKLELQNRISTPKQRKDNFEAIFQRIFKRKITSAKLRKSADKSLSQPGCSHSNTIYNLQLQKTIVLRKQPQHQATTFMQPFQCDLAPQLQETHRTTHTGTSIVAKHIEGTKRPQPQPPHRRGSFHRRLQPLYTEKRTVSVSCSGFLPNTKPMQHSCSHSNAIWHHSFKKRIELGTQEQPLLQTP